MIWIEWNGEEENDFAAIQGVCLAAAELNQMLAKYPPPIGAASLAYHLIVGTFPSDYASVF
jgi:hypothetical protein